MPHTFITFALIAKATGPAAAAARASAPEVSAHLAVFSLTRGGPSAGEYEAWTNSRRCLSEAMPRAVRYDDILFHEGNVPLEMVPLLREAT
ncbi:MAG: hypothetical protein SGPRY_005459 [Prymnesium sp.]